MTIHAMFAKGFPYSLFVCVFFNIPTRFCVRGMCLRTLACTAAAATTVSIHTLTHHKRLAGWLASWLTEWLCVFVFDATQMGIEHYTLICIHIEYVYRGIGSVARNFLLFTKVCICVKKSTTKNQLCRIWTDKSELKSGSAEALAQLTYGIASAYRTKGKLQFTHIGFGHQEKSQTPCHWNWLAHTCNTQEPNMPKHIVLVVAFAQTTKQSK